MSAQTKDILCLLPSGINTTLSEGFLFQGNMNFSLTSSLNGVSLQWRCVSVAVGTEPFGHLTQSRVANEELASFLKRFQGGMMADWELCLHSELFPVVV